MSWRNEVKNWDGKLYKVLQGNKSCHGGDFEWDLPEGDNPSNWTPVIEDVKMCEIGYHLTTHYAHWSGKDNIFVYEAEGNVIEFDGHDKVVCTRVRLLRKVKNPFSKNNIGKDNSGNYNTGDKNSGNYNIGDKNSGNYNFGNNNTGNYNFGSWNSGNSNDGYYNSGNYNYGNYNFGSWNFGNHSSGYFCTGYYYKSNRIFNKLIPKDWKPKFPEWIYFELLSKGYSASWCKAFEKANIEGIKELLALPNFDYEIFERITSITKKQIKKKLGE